MGGGPEHWLREVAFGRWLAWSWEKADPPHCSQEGGVWSIFSRKQAQPQALGCLIDFFSS